MSYVNELKVIEKKHLSPIQCAEAFFTFYNDIPRYEIESRKEVVDYLDQWLELQKESIFYRALYVRIIYCKAQYSNMVGDYKVIFRIIAEINNLEPNESDYYFLGRIHRVITLSFYSIGLVNQAIENAFKSIKYLDAIEDEKESIATLMTVAISYSLIEDYDLQLKYFKEGYKRCLVINDVYLRMMFLSNIAYTLILKENYKEAKEYLLKSENIEGADNEALYSIAILINRVRILIYDKEINAAKLMLDRVLSHKNLNTEQTLVMDTHLLGAQIAELENDLLGQKKFFDAGLEIAETIKSDKYLLVFYGKLKDYYEEQGDFEKAFISQSKQMKVIVDFEKKKTNYQYIYIGIQYEVDNIKKELFNLKHETKELKNVLESTKYELQGTQESAIFALASLAEYRDQVTGKHILRTIKYVEAFCMLLKKEGYDLSDEYIVDFSKSSALHDIGKVGIKDAILNKPARLNDEEFEQIKQHTIIGRDALNITEKILGEGSFLSLAQSIAYTHHEKWNGNGYPEGLAGDAIPFEGRLVAIIDVYDALISKRPYKGPFGHKTSIEIIKKGLGNHFDPKLGQIFLDNHQFFYEIAYELIDSEEERKALKEK